MCPPLTITTDVNWILYMEIKWTGRVPYVSCPNGDRCHVVCPSSRTAAITWLRRLCICRHDAATDADAAAEADAECKHRRLLIMTTFIDVVLVGLLDILAVISRIAMTNVLLSHAVAGRNMHQPPCRWHLNLALCEFNYCITPRTKFFYCHFVRSPVWPVPVLWLFRNSDFGSTFINPMLNC